MNTILPIALAAVLGTGALAQTPALFDSVLAPARQASRQLSAEEFRLDNTAYILKAGTRCRSGQFNCREWEMR